MGLFDVKKGLGIMDEIRCDESSYLIWKWRPKGSDGSRRENAVRWGSSLRVKTGEVAVFVYRNADGVVQDYIEGPFDATLDTMNLPVIAPIVSLVYGGGTPFPAEVYFINWAQIIQVRFGVPFFDIFDPRFPDYGVPVAVRGTISFRIDDYQQFVNAHSLSEFSMDDFQKQIRDAVSRYVKDVVINALTTYSIPVVQIESKISQINNDIEFIVSQRLNEDFAVTVISVDVSAIELDKDSEGYQQLMAVTRDITAMKVQAEAMDYVERIKMQREEDQYAQRKHTQSENLNAFIIEKQAEIGRAGADALGHDGVAGGNGNMSNPANLMAGMAVGGAVGKSIANAISSLDNSVTTTNQGVSVPPPIKKTLYHVALNGQAAGPFDLDGLQQLVLTGQITKTSLVWTAGMAEWEPINSIPELRSICELIPPNLK